MNKTFVSPLVGWVISALLLAVSIWYFATDGLWEGFAFVALAIVWAVVALRQAKKSKEK
ncbi:hypothetical protein ABNP34_16480 (plasmid) [Glutamicibacter mishrai]|uniref:hypothetical protein n=1 Tax=Glutamicibacter mishrai TaxID=1775880 RepID=UPI0003B4050F